MPDAVFWDVQSEKWLGRTIMGQVETALCCRSTYCEASNSLWLNLTKETCWFLGFLVIFRSLFPAPCPQPLWIKEPTVQCWKPSHIRMSQHVTSEPCPVSLFLEEASARSADSVSGAAILSKSFLAHLSKSCFALWPALTCHLSAENKLWKICASLLMTSLSQPCIFTDKCEKMQVNLTISGQSLCRNFLYKNGSFV